MTDLFPLTIEWSEATRAAIDALEEALREWIASLQTLAALLVDVDDLIPRIDEILEEYRESH